MWMIVPMLTTMNCEYRFFDIQHFFMSAEKNGFTTAELWCGPMHFFLDYRCHDSVTALSKLAINHGVHIVAICPQQTNPNPYNVAVRNIAARKRTYLYFCNAIDVAHELGANIVTITAGWGYLNESAGDALLRSIEMLKRVAIYAEKQNITIALEALQSWESNLPCHTSLDLAHILDAVGSPALRVCLDTGAMDAAGETIHDYFTNLGTNIVHCHFVDSGTESHVAFRRVLFRSGVMVDATWQQILPLLLRKDMRAISQWKR